MQFRKLVLDTLEDKNVSNIKLQVKGIM